MTKVKYDYFSIMQTNLIVIVAVFLVSIIFASISFSIILVCVTYCISSLFACLIFLSVNKKKDEGMFFSNEGILLFKKDGTQINCDWNLLKSYLPYRKFYLAYVFKFVNISTQEEFEYQIINLNKNSFEHLAKKFTPKNHELLLNISMKP